MQQYHVYIMSNRSHTLYTGVTNDLKRRVYQYKIKAIDGFTAKYNITRLVHYEAFNNVGEAIAREKKIKGWLRIKKVELIESGNRYWRDLAADWYADLTPSGQAPTPELGDAPQANTPSQR